MAIIKIRDADGNVQEVLAIKGEPGKDGANGKDGVDGKDYVLTEADKQEIANMISSGMVSVVDTEAVDAHIADKNNPHNVTCEQIGAVTQTELNAAVTTALNNANIAYVGSAAPANDVGKDGDIYIVSG